mgnify:CR=1 FL=1
MSSHQVPEVLLFHSPQPDYAEEIGDYLPVKAKALLCHGSQSYPLGQAGEALGISGSRPVRAVRERFKLVLLAPGKDT